jgi:hypothetical protein
MAMDPRIRHLLLVAVISVIHPALVLFLFYFLM